MKIFQRDSSDKYSFEKRIIFEIKIVFALFNGFVILIYTREIQRTQVYYYNDELLIRKLGTYCTIAKIAHPAVQVSGLSDGGCGLPLCRVVEVRLTKGLLPVRGRMVLHYRSSVLGRAFCQKQ